MLPTEGAQSSRHRSIIIAAVIAAAVAIGYFSYTHKSAQFSAGSPQNGARMDASKRPSAVGVTTARLADINVFQSGLGTAVPRNIVTVRTRVDGQLLRVLFKEGQLVKDGDLLAEIDPRPYQVLLTQARGQMARDAAQLKNAQVDYERYKTLLAQDSTSQQQLDTQAALVRQYQGAIESDKGQIDSANLSLTYAKITAPLSGRAGLRQVDPGNIVHAADTSGIVVIAQVQPMTVVFAVPETRIAQIMAKTRSGVPVPVEAWDRDNKNKLAAGLLAALDNQVDISTGTVKLRAEFPNADYALFPNQFVNARALVDTRREAVAIPSAAVQVGNAGSFVYLVKPDDTVSVRNVTPGPSEGNMMAIEKGLAAGDVVVIDGVDKLREGAKIISISRDGPRPDAARQDGPVPDAAARSGTNTRRRHQKTASGADLPSGE